MIFIKKNLYGLTVVLMFLLFVLPISFLYANGETTIPCVPTAGKICNPIRTDDLNGFVKTLLQGVLRIGIPIVALAIIYCGFLFVEARGNTEKLTKAKDALLYTLIGAAILLGSWAIAQLISETVLSL